MLRAQMGSSDLTLALLAAGLFFVAPGGSRNSGDAAGPQVLEVRVVEAAQKDVPIYQEWIGTLDGLVNADIKAQVSGYLVEQAYTEGSFVRKGQLLFQIDSRPFQAALDQASAQLAQSQAALANARAVQRRTELDVQRYTPLAEQQAASQQDLDNSVQNNLAA